MKKIAAILIFAFNCLLIQAQIINPSQSSVGLDFGLSKGCFGSTGVFYAFRPDFLKKHVEFNAGIGLEVQGGAFVYGLGAKYCLYSNSKNLELFLAFDYSHRGLGNDVEDANDTSLVTYRLSSTQYLDYYVACRYYLDGFIVLQSCIGYAQNISGYSIQLINGPNTKYYLEQYYQSSEILLELDFIVTFKRKTQP